MDGAKRTFLTTLCFAHHERLLETAHPDTSTLLSTGGLPVRHSLGDGWIEGLAVSSGNSSLNITTVTIPEAVYKVAQRSGSFPDAVIGLWDDIFSSGYKQIHTINFEVYDGDLDAAPHVAVYLATR